MVVCKLDKGCVGGVIFICSILILIGSWSVFAVWRIHSSAIPAIEQVKLLHETYPLVVEVAWDQFLQDTSTNGGASRPFDNQLVHLVGHLSTPDRLVDPLFGVSFDNDSIDNDTLAPNGNSTSTSLLILNRAVDVYQEVLHPGGPFGSDSYSNEWYNCVNNHTCYYGNKISKSSLPFSPQAFVAEPIYLGWSRNSSNAEDNSNCIRLISDDAHIIQSVQNWAVPFDRPLSIASIKNATNNEHIFRIEQANGFGYRLSKPSKAGVLQRNDIRVTYTMVPVPGDVISIVAALLCTASTILTDSISNSSSTDGSNATGRLQNNCELRSFIGSTVGTENNGVDVQLPFHLLERGNYTSEDMYQRSYRTVIRSTLRSFTPAYIAMILASFLHAFFLWKVFGTFPSHLCGGYDDNSIRQEARQPPGICCCRVLVWCLMFSSITGFFSSLFIFSMIWIIHGISLSIMVPLAVISLIMTSYLYITLIINEAKREQITGTVCQWVLLRLQPPIRMKSGAIPAIQLTLGKKS